MPRASRKPVLSAPPVAIMSTIVMMAIKDIRPYEQNPRINADTVDELVKLIPRVGFNVPLLIDRANVIVKGHSRWLAAQRLGMAEIPCIYSEADDEANDRDRIADNRVHEFSTWDDEMLMSEVSSLNLGGFDISSLGFVTEHPSFARPAVPADQDQELVEEPFITAEDVAATLPKPPEYREVTCPTCSHTLYMRKRS